ncbi:hypothetical protein R1flu_009997 [Riccia fluitans]|uniref:ribonuclease H n=1 Tax=Riccia fluitans TaxID=41844 RepID=A0ABD1Z4I8_9MARC
MQKSQVVIAIDGACRGNGTPNATAAYGVFFGRNSRYNEWDLLPVNERQTSQNAEIYAAQQALERARAYLIDDLTTVNLITDSSYLTKSMTEYIYKWLRNGFRASGNGLRIVNADAVYHLNSTIEFFNNCDVEVLFWNVRREQNTDADRLANLAFSY